MYQWFKWRKTYSHGYGYSSWRYDYISVNTPQTIDQIDDYIREELLEYDEDGHYRGFDLELIDVPPTEVIEELIEYHSKRIHDSTLFLEYLAYDLQPKSTPDTEE